MARGGARVNSGPPPDPHALRRDRPQDVATWRTLPSEGREGAPPRWPLPLDVVKRAQLQLARADLVQFVREFDSDAAGATPRDLAARAKKVAGTRLRIAMLVHQIKQQTRLERALWRSLWRLPQAVAWQQDSSARAVAQYVRHQVASDLGSLDDAKESRQWSDRIGLSPASLQRLRWKVAVDEIAPRRAAHKAAASVKRSSSRDRLKVVPGGSGP